ncbi:hypothetical protein JZ751_026814 [Albula glossodonta]|uniref:rhomboid protease n=1 Tax=Albula glossodonta TaxID=121402 RepID=A0A8T2PH09_9TELE|nr:hypothetical protein JZ751_026814 [Albula glossodonta]
MSEGARDVQVHSSPAVAANAEGDEIEVLESTDVLPVAPEDVTHMKGVVEQQVELADVSGEDKEGSGKREERGGESGLVSGSLFQARGPRHTGLMEAGKGPFVIVIASYRRRCFCLVLGHSHLEPDQTWQPAAWRKGDRFFSGGAMVAECLLARVCMEGDGSWGKSARAEGLLCFGGVVVTGTPWGCSAIVLNGDYRKLLVELVRPALTMKTCGDGKHGRQKLAEVLQEKFDPESSGFISTERFRDLLAAHGSELDPHKLEVLLALADGNADGKICYQDFVNLLLFPSGAPVAFAFTACHNKRPGEGVKAGRGRVVGVRMSNKRSNSFRRAILQGGRQLKGATLKEEVGLGLSQRLVRHIAYETLPREIDRKWYFDMFMYYGLQLDRWVLQVSHPMFLKGPLPYHPQLRAQAWRYLTYVFMHAGQVRKVLDVVRSQARVRHRPTRRGAAQPYSSTAEKLEPGKQRRQEFSALLIEHLGLNMAMQLLVGVPLEMVHGAVRIGLVYICGVLAGSLAVSVADMTAPVVGSSGGVYALVSAHLANVVMVMSVEFGRAVWLRFYPPAFPPCPNPSFVAHLGGVAVGLTLGVVVLHNYEQRLQEQSLFWIFFCVYTLFVLCAVFWNVIAYGLLDVKLPPTP